MEVIVLPGFVVTHSFICLTDTRTNSISCDAIVVLRSQSAGCSLRVAFNATSSASATHPDSRRTERRNFGVNPEPFEDNLERRFRGTQADVFAEVHAKCHHPRTRCVIWLRQIGGQRDGLLAELLILL